MIETTPSASLSSPGVAELIRALSVAPPPPASPPSAGPAPPSLRIAFQPDDVASGLGRLVLTLIELIRELLERQAVRRIEAGSLSPLEIDRVGTTFLRLSEQLEALKVAFGLEGEDLNLDLGPLGTLLDDPRGN